ncbi:hypothetical protein GOP47_0009529, partial [Adiantum capillus-veneris]
MKLQLGDEKKQHARECQVRGQGRRDSGVVEDTDVSQKGMMMLYTRVHMHVNPTGRRWNGSLEDRMHGDEGMCWVEGRFLEIVEERPRGRPKRQIDSITVLRHPRNSALRWKRPDQATARYLEEGKKVPCSSLCS